MGDAWHGFTVLTVLLHASATPTPTVTPSPTVTATAIPASSSDTGLVIALVVVIVLLAVAVVALLLRLRRPRGEAVPRPQHEPDPPPVPDRPKEPDRRPSRAEGVALDQRDTLAQTCMDVAESLEHNALAARLQLGLKHAGYEILAPTGGRFDPEVHEAFERRPTDDPALNLIVAATMRPGYRLDGQIVRHAKVVVFRADPQA
jgi:GrpE protein